MQIFQTLKNRNVALLWGGQVLSALGDEVYRVAIVWFAVQKLGAISGFLIAAQVGAIFLLSLFGGAFLNKWSFRITLVWIDLIRFFALLALVMVGLEGDANAWIFFPVVLLVSGLTALFEPAMQGMVPAIATGAESNHRVNGLLLTTRLMARIIGPFLIGFCGKIVPMIHFFTFDALTFVASAIAIALISSGAQVSREPKSCAASPLYGFRLLNGHSSVKKVILAKFLVSGAWYAIFSVGLAMFVNQRMPGDLQAYGRIISLYGVGSIVGVILVGRSGIGRPALLAMLGILATGTGFLGIAFSQTDWQIGFFAAVSALGGPMFDLAFLKLIQERFHASDLSQVYRLRVTIDNGGMLLFLLISPWILTILPAATMIAYFGGVIFLVGGFGAMHFFREEVAKTRKPAEA